MLLERSKFCIVLFKFGDNPAGMQLAWFENVLLLHHNSPICVADIKLYLDNHRMMTSSKESSISQGMVNI